MERNYKVAEKIKKKSTCVNTLKREFEALKINVIKSINNYYIVINSVKSNEIFFEI